MKAQDQDAVQRSDDLPQLAIFTKLAHQKWRSVLCVKYEVDGWLHHFVEFLDVREKDKAKPRLMNSKPMLSPCLPHSSRVWRQI